MDMYCVYDQNVVFLHKKTSIGKAFKMDKIKGFIKRNKKIIIPVITMIMLLIVSGIYLISQGNSDSDKKINETNGETVQTSEDEKKTDADNDSKVEEDITDKSSSQAENKNSSDEGKENDKSADNSSDSKESSDSGSANSSHIHVWKEHTKEKWVSDIVTVVDEPEQTVKYSIYRMYWYTTGKWEETRDPERFDQWYKSKEGGLYTIYHPYKNPEDNPLFIQYDKNGNPMYTNDHSIIGPYYEIIPAVTHEEDHGYYETYVDYYYCECGATK